MVDHVENCMVICRHANVMCWKLHLTNFVCVPQQLSHLCHIRCRLHSTGQLATILHAPGGVKGVAAPPSSSPSTLRPCGGNLVLQPNSSLLYWLCNPHFLPVKFKCFQPCAFFSWCLQICIYQRMRKHKYRAWKVTWKATHLGTNLTTFKANQISKLKCILTFLREDPPARLRPSAVFARWFVVVLPTPP